MLYNNFVQPCVVAYVTFCTFVSAAGSLLLLRLAPNLGMQCTRQELVRDCAPPSLRLLNETVVLMRTVSSSVSAQMTCS